MKAFVTGSTGLLGSNLVQVLLKSGYEVKALARSKEKAARFLKEPEIEIVVGDMENVAGFANQLAGCDLLFHTAAFFRDYFQPGDHWQTLQNINVKSTINLLDEAEKRGIKKATYVSSSGVLANRPDGSASDESDISTSPSALKNLYFRSKVLAEIEVDKFLASHSLPVVLILPTVMLGPGDAGPTGTRLPQPKIAGYRSWGFANGRCTGRGPGNVEGGRLR